MSHISGNVEYIFHVTVSMSRDCYNSQDYNEFSSGNYLLYQLYC